MAILKLSSALLLAGALVESVIAHGLIRHPSTPSPHIACGTQFPDGYTTPQPLRVVRATKPDSGFISDVTSPDITCSIGNSKLPPGPITATVAAGQDVTMLWNTWPIGHYGPVLNYMAKCPGDCSTWKGDSGTPWFKISQSVYNNGQWASDALAQNNASYTVRIPRNITPGNYLLRHENLALHAASNVGGAQFYPSPVEDPSTHLAWASRANHPGIHFNPYQGEAANQAYVPPGGSVYPGLQF
ncbi:hypothetical protein ONZ45_g1308 [Pleurotus djamor]|nr:hypothetical protein ONZ45_g1308 [Pleurotus djamor]